MDERSPLTGVTIEGFVAREETREGAPRGLGDFQRRSNRDRDWRGRQGGGPSRNSWDATPRTRDDGPSVRIPNAQWDSTPRNRDGDGDGGWGNARNRRWDAPTPRAARGESPEGDGAIGFDAREWEEEQVKLDRDWYMGAEEGVLAGDEEHNPLASYQDLEQAKQAEIATKQVKKISARQAQYVSNRSVLSYYLT